MGRYKDYRELKRRGYETITPPRIEQPKGGRAIQGRARRKYRSRSKQSSNGSIPRKALGLSPWSADPRHSCTSVDLEAAGRQQRARRCSGQGPEIGQDQKGPEITEVIEVDLSTAQLGSSAARRPATVLCRSVGRSTSESIGTVKMYKTDKGFGFVGQDNGGKDVLVQRVGPDPCRAERAG